RILRECQRHIAKNVAGKLVQHDDFCQTPRRPVAPGMEFTSTSRSMGHGKTGADRAIQFRALPEPVGWFERIEPEHQNVVARAHCVGSHVHYLMSRRFYCTALSNGITAVVAPCHAIRE